MTRPGEAPDRREPPDDAVRELLLRRAARLRQPEEDLDPEESDGLPVAEFSVGDDLFALPLASLRATIPLRLVTVVPLAPAHVLGVLRYEGQLVCAFSAASLLGRAWKTDPSVLLVVEHGRDRLFALDSERIPKPSVLPKSALAAAAPEDALIRLITSPGTGCLRLIDVSELMARATREEKSAS